MQEANSDTKFKKGQQDADFFKKLHKVSGLLYRCHSCTARKEQKEKNACR